MGSSPSKKIKPPSNKGNDRLQRFPLDGSIKSATDSYIDDFGLTGSMKSIVLLETEKPSELHLKSVGDDKDKQILELQQENQELRKKIEDLQKRLDQLSLQVSVAKTTKQQAAKNRLGPKNLPHVGDHVIAMWGHSKWQYFTATIQSFEQSTLEYTIEWDDNDPTGRVVKYYDLAVDKIPEFDQIGVGSKVLFHQATYKSSQVRNVTRSGGLRWHQGKIERIYNGEDGIKRFDGRHTKGQADGKWVSYKGYSERFIGYTIDDLRMPPNVFDILDDSADANISAANNNGDSYDVFVSYAKINCPSAFTSNEIDKSNLPPSYQEAVLSNMCDPRDIVRNLKAMGVKVFVEEEDEASSLIEVVTALKKVKLFIACLSDEYASNDRCRMEFQYAKKTLKIPVIPVVVGSGSFQWQLTVVGLLIAGELYIHFQNKEVEQSKMTELARTIKNFIPSIQISGAHFPATGNAILPLHNNPSLSVTGGQIKSGAADYFFSYCWRNSQEAFKLKQITDCVGGQWSDPRFIVRKLYSAKPLNYWLDIERLQSASESLGMFDQIATAMNECKFVVACVSREYAESDNSRMEFQFAVKSLKKPVMALIVGKGNEWKETTVGKLIQEDCVMINLQDISSSKEFDLKIKDIVNEMSKVAEKGKDEESDYRAPVPGDHVVCLHQGWAYFMATVVSFDETTLKYTVDWDDGDPSGRVQSYQDLALDVVPSEEIGVGSIILFQQGQYGGTEGNNSGGDRYHQGKVTKVYVDGNGMTRYDGEHTKGVNDGKWISYRGYEKRFSNATKENIRVSPNPMDALMACKQAFKIKAAN